MINPMIIKRVEKTSDTPYGCLVVKDVPVDRPAIVAFGGELTLDTHGANSYAKMLQKLFDENNVHGIDIYSVIYDFGSRNAQAERAELFNIAKCRIHNKALVHIKTAPGYVSQLYNMLLRPRIIDTENKKMSVTDAISNVHKIKFYAHCHGAAALWQMAQLMRDDMLNIGFSAKEATRILREILVIQHSPIAPLYRQHFSTLSFASADDTMMQCYDDHFSQWVCDNSADIVPCVFNIPGGGHVFIAGHLKQDSFKEHEPYGLVKSDSKKYKLTPDGEIIFSAERNALLRAANDAINNTATTSARALTDGNGVDFSFLQENGNTLFNIMSSDLRQQIPKRDYQK